MTKARGKVCAICKKWKPSLQFFKSNISRDGLTFYCQACKDEPARQEDRVKKRIRATLKHLSTKELRLLRVILEDRIIWMRSESPA